MHMADALISPAVGGTMWAASAGALAWSARRLRQQADDRRVPLMGVLGAFVFAAQMLNFTIPLTGSSGHLGGGLLLAILLGPHAAFIVMASVLAVQALFFADGGLLALGCNLFNLGVYPAFIAHPLLYRPLAGAAWNPRRAGLASMVAAVAGLQLGAFSVVLQTTLSGISSLPFSSFALLMSPIHLAIGAVEGLATAGVIAFVARSRPELVTGETATAAPAVGLRPVASALLAAAVLTGGVASWFASTRPDGLEWSIFAVTGKEEVESESRLHARMARIQEGTAFLPDYDFKVPASGRAADGDSAGDPDADSWPAVNAGTTVAGWVGGALVLILSLGAAYVIRPRRRVTAQVRAG